MELSWSQVVHFWPVALGGGLGFAYYKFVGCRSGACPLTSNPWLSTLYGAMIGWLILSQ